MTCINKENYELMKSIREFAISYCTFYEATGGRIGTYPDELIDKTIACFEKVLYNRLFVQKNSGETPKTFKDNLQMATDIIEGNAKEDRVHSVIRRLYSC